MDDCTGVAYFFGVDGFGVFVGFGHECLYGYACAFGVLHPLGVVGVAHAVYRFQLSSWSV